MVSVRTHSDGLWGVAAGLRTPDVFKGHFGVASGRLDRRVAEQPLDRANVSARLEKMRREAVSQGVRRHAFGETALNDGLVQDPLDRTRRDRAT